MWPTGTQRLLLRICLGLESDVRGAVASWVQGSLQHGIDEASRQLLPLLSRRINQSSADPWLIELAGSERKRSWYDSHVQLRVADSIGETLNSAAIQWLPLKGVALVIDATYDAVGDRPSADIDVLVNPDDVPAAITALQTAGWTLTYPRAELELAPCQIIDYSHAATLVRGPRENLDLHWSALHRFGRLGSETQSFMTGARPVAFNGNQYRVLNPEDQLLHTCAHGARWDSPAPIRWLADAWKIVDANPELDWNALVNKAKQTDTSSRVYETLDYLSRELDLQVPDSVLARLKRHPASRLSRLEDALAHTSSGGLARGYAIRGCRTYRLARTQQPRKHQRLRCVGRYARIWLLAPQRGSATRYLWSKFRARRTRTKQRLATARSH